MKNEPKIFQALSKSPEAIYKKKKKRKKEGREEKIELRNQL